jgi:hypothetical protein
MNSTGARRPRGWGPLPLPRNGALIPEPLRQRWAGSRARARAERSSGVNTLAGTSALAKLAARGDRIMLPAWIYVLTALVAGTA